MTDERYFLCLLGFSERAKRNEHGAKRKACDFSRHFLLLPPVET
jgi:hypothetical protein